jgi:hypothetical protein
MSWAAVKIVKAKTSSENVVVGIFPFNTLDIMFLIFRSAIARKNVVINQKQG